MNILELLEKFKCYLTVLIHLIIYNQNELKNN